MQSARKAELQKIVESNPKYSAFMEIQNIHEEQAIKQILQQRFGATEYDAMRIGKKIHDILSKLGKQKGHELDSVMSAKSKSSGEQNENIS